YLSLIERKVGALDQAAPLRGWDLPEAFATLRRLLEVRMGPRNHDAAGKRAYVQVLRLLESFPLGEVEAAVREALRPGAVGFDAIKRARDAAQLRRLLALAEIYDGGSRGDAARIGAKVVSHGRYVTFQLAEVAVPRELFREILSLIDDLRPRPAPA
ncbi:MAG: hypothetical protein O7I42_26940, partial [Alphaproteobacteria bacterium]|nr:hypothetical protein [Alphaproteobacteria bacterium]